MTDRDDREARDFARDVFDGRPNPLDSGTLARAARKVWGQQPGMNGQEMTDRAAARLRSLRPAQTEHPDIRWDRHDHTADPGRWIVNGTPATVTRRHGDGTTTDVRPNHR